ncbi:MAG TPA: MBL fold metallo-hydrolase [Candidatus Pelethocola excrementipullorum]|nr:MBL fold metallo-hydrolase [Candidatus Pelethocola excrementipullorum]
MLSKALPYYEFKDGIFEIDEFDCVSIFVIVGTKRALVLDAGTGIGDLRWVIENRITKKPYDVVITHNHTDHIGGAGFFDEIWVHENDSDWENLKVGPELEQRRWYANLICSREDKNYAYDVDRDIVEWPRKPEKKLLRDKKVFDLGGRKVTIYHCPGHTAGQCVAIDDLSKTLFVSDACNRELLLSEEIGDSKEKSVEIALNSLERLQDMYGIEYEDVYNAHHDFRGVGAPLGKEVLPNAVRCLRSMKEGTAVFEAVHDPLSDAGSEKKVAVYGNVHISYV